MALKIRLRQQGRNNRPFYRLVLTNARSPRDGKYIEGLGWYNPFEEVEERHLSIKPDRIQYWLDQGAIISDNVQAILAKAAPEVLKHQREKVLAQRAKLSAKRRARRKAVKKTGSN
jgi:small subunit ribosomal protein S16